MFEGKVLDMIELGIEMAQSMAELKVRGDHALPLALSPESDSCFRFDFRLRNPRPVTVL